MSPIFSRRSKRGGGYSTAELVVYVGLVTLLVAAIVQTAVTTATSHRRSRAFLDMNSAAVTAFSRFSRDVRRATAVDVPNSTLDASSGKLALLMRRDDGTNDSTTFYLEDATVKVSENGSYVGDLSPDGLDVSNLTFRRFAAGSTTAVRIEMTLAPSASTSVPALNFYSTYVLRGSYID